MQLGDGINRQDCAAVGAVYLDHAVGARAVSARFVAGPQCLQDLVDQVLLGVVVVVVVVVVGRGHRLCTIWAARCGCSLGYMVSAWDVARSAWIWASRWEKKVYMVQAWGVLGRVGWLDL